MQRQRPAWWIWLIGVPLSLSALVSFAASLTGPVGWSVRRISDPQGETRLVITNVRPGSAAAEARLQPGDVLDPGNLEQFITFGAPGREFRLDIDRAGGQRTVLLRVPRKDWAYWRSARALQFLLVLAGSLASLGLAILIVNKRPNDLVARWGALFLAEQAALGWLMGFGGAVPGIPPEFIAVLRRLPSPLSAAAMVGSSISVTLPGVAATFLGWFPRTPPRGSRLVFLWLPALVTLPLDLEFFWLPTYWPAISPVPAWLIRLAMVVGAAYLLTAVMLLVRHYSQITDRNERRRIRLLVVGLAMWAGDGALALTVMAMPRTDVFDAIRSGYWEYAPIGHALLYLLGPLCIAYAILRHRMFDIAVMVRLGLQYAAARGLLVSLVPLMGIALVLDLLAHGHQPLLEALRQRSWLYAALAAGGYALHVWQARWLRALDRRFFRERYDAQQLLNRVVGDVRRSATFEDAAAHVVADIDSAVHPEFTALISLDRLADAYRVLAGCGAVPPPPNAAGRLMALVRALGRPLEIPPGETGWVLQQLPREESDFLRGTRVEWLFPIALAPAPIEALLMLGPKRSDEPYSGEDQQLLQAIAGSLALLLERPPPGVTPEGLEECAECGTCYDTGTGRCARDGTATSVVPFPRTIARRYRLDQRLGGGGMGIVYRGFDDELGRRVAIKLIRPELVSGEHAVARFRFEAKAAAAFSHPNVVTVHDFGVAPDGRAYLVMELLDGCTLREAIDRDGRLETKRAMRVLQGVTAAVAAAHARGLLHRDLKPENVLVTITGGEETAKVLDFGVVKQLPAHPEATTRLSLSTPGMLAGTLRYMAPEQVCGEQPAKSWDLWALAILACETLTGVYPFRELTLLPPGVGEVNLQAIPAEWRTFFGHALSADRIKRPTSAVSFFAELQATVADRQRS